MSLMTLSMRLMADFASILKQRGCIVVFATYAIFLLHTADQILILPSGRLERNETYDQLIRAGATLDMLEVVADEEHNDEKIKEAEISAASDQVSEANERAKLR
ncbi:hypothetical protein CRV24_009772 [Beauveria bassiana]|nr:hypothetical protein CRV24_009772 [Beauveria bassiana]KAH8708066.1 hypothetical protein HC256_010214 [Beauveria bassiana]